MLTRLLMMPFRSIREIHKSYSDHKDSLAMWGGEYDESQIDELEDEAVSEHIWGTYHNPYRDV